MPKYWGKQIFAHGRFPEVGQKQKTEEKKEERERERLNNGENNGQATHGARKHAWRTQAAWANKDNFFNSCIVDIIDEAVKKKLKVSSMTHLVVMNDTHPPKIYCTYFIFCINLKELPSMFGLVNPKMG